MFVWSPHVDVREQWLLARNVARNYRSLSLPAQVFRVTEALLERGVGVVREVTGVGREVVPDDGFSFRPSVYPNLMI